MAQNPIINGWCSDPSILRVDKDYYLASSTFEWMPGVNLYHSRDLVHWEQLPSALMDDTLVPMEGLEPSCCIWAPNLTWHDGLFYIAYTIVQTARYRFKDTHNFLITAKDICGPWSKPVYVGSTGFDPSVFHDDAGGKKYLVTQTMEHRTNRNRFAGVSVQELDSELHPIGLPRVVFPGTSRGTTEGPNIIRRGDWYYITVAEGGTEFGHCVTIARSRNLFGPYEADPQSHMMSSAGTDCELQRAGHGQLIDDPDGRWYMAHLCARPLEGKYSILGRECAIQNIEWSEDGWPRIAGTIGRTTPSLTFQGPDVEPVIYPEEPETICFGDGLTRLWMTLRSMWPHCGISFDARKGWMRITGGNSLCSHYRQHLTARRITSLHCSGTVHMSFKPQTHNHMAGLVCMYNCDNWHYLAMSCDDNGHPVLTVTTCAHGDLEDRTELLLPDSTEDVQLRAEVCGGDLRFLWALPGGRMQPVGPTLDMRILSDEYVIGNGFTSAMIGVCCQDLQGNGCYADFEWFTYRNE